MTAECAGRKLQDYLRWRNANARHRGILPAQRRERARIRSQYQQRSGRLKPPAAPRDQPGDALGEASTIRPGLPVWL